MAINGAVNTVVYEEAWREKLQEELDEPNKWEDICNVEFTSDYVIHNPYLTDPSVHVIGRGTPYTFDPTVRTDESITISNSAGVMQFIDRADLAQSGYMKQMELAQRQGVLVKEHLEKAVYQAHSGFTDFGTEDLAGTAGGTTAITVSTTNIDDIILTILKTFDVANGQSLLARNGAFIVWRPGDFLILKQFMMANGFATADVALKNGVTTGIDYMGVTHYSSNLLVSNHVFAGIKKCLHLGILNTTYGSVMVDDKDPGLQSGISVVSRIDWAVKVWTKLKPVLLDINVT